MIGITRFGAYVPRLRLSRSAVVEANSWFNPALKAHAKGVRSMCGWDEDAVTMAVAAARDGLHGVEKPEIGSVVLASTTLPFADRDCAGLMADALDLGSRLETHTQGGSQRAATSALARALRTQQVSPAETLVVASEKRPSKAASTWELTNGDGAAAFTLGTKEIICEFLGSTHLSVDFVDHYRGSGPSAEFDYGWEERWIRDEGYLKIVPEAVARLLDDSGLDASAVAHFILPAPSAVSQRVAAICGIEKGRVADNLHLVMGEAGTAHPLIMLAHVLERAKPGDAIMVVGWGQGCDAILLRATDRIAEAKPRLGLERHLSLGREETCYTRYLAFNDLIEFDRGLRSELDKQTALSAFWRNRHTLTRFSGGKCTKCGTVQIPKSNVCVNPNCTAIGTQIDHPMADKPADIQSWTADKLTYSPDPPQYFGMIVFDGGGRLMADITDVDVGEVSVGMPVRMEFRIKDYDDRRGFTRYFWKATPDRAAQRPAAATAAASKG
jgi:hydroxymethylglutaryl-CoA synthase